MVKIWYGKQSCKYMEECPSDIFKVFITKNVDQWHCTISLKSNLKPDIFTDLQWFNRVVRDISDAPDAESKTHSFDR